MKKLDVKTVIEQFFEGKNHFERDLGFFWVANHGRRAILKEEWNIYIQKELQNIPNIYSTDEDFVYISEFQTLTFEPISGGQYEIAVRIWSEGEWKGYMINNPEEVENLFFRGVNTAGH